MSVGDGCMPSLVVRRLKDEASIGEVVGVLEDGYRQSTVDGCLVQEGGIMNPNLVVLHAG